MGNVKPPTIRNLKPALFAITLVNILTLTPTTSARAQTNAPNHQDCMVIADLTARHRCHRSASKNSASERPDWGQWQIGNSVSLFDDKPIVTARLRSIDRQENLLGVMQHADLVARCGEGVVIVAIHSDKALWAYGSPQQPNALIRFDQSAATQFSFSRDASGETIGYFETQAATELLKSIADSGEMLVRLARGTQAPATYTFDLSGAENLPELFERTCAVNPN